MHHSVSAIQQVHGVAEMLKKGSLSDKTLLQSCKKVSHTCKKHTNILIQKAVPEPMPNHMTLKQEKKGTVPLPS